MSIFNEICMSIDIINNESRSYNGFWKRRYIKKNKKRMQSIIDKYVDITDINIDMLVDFMNVYKETINRVSIQNLYLEMPDEYTISLIYNRDNGNVIKFTYDDRTNNSRSRIKIFFKDKPDSSSTKVCEANYNFKYIGIDEEYKRIMNYCTLLIKFIIKNYLYSRMYM